MTYNMIYVDGKSGISYAKRFNVTGITRDKEYDLTKGEKNSKVQYFTANPNGEAEVITISLSPSTTARIKNFDYYFEELAIKGRSSQGNQVIKHAIKSIRFKEKGRSTLAGKKIWYDDNFGRLNTDEKGTYLGSFEEQDKVIVFYKDGTYELTDLELTQRFETEQVMLIHKFNPEGIVTAVYYDADKQHYNLKRFRIETQTMKNKFLFIKEGSAHKLMLATLQKEPIAQLKNGKKKADATVSELELSKLAEVTGWKTVGTKISEKDLLEINLISEDEPETSTPAQDSQQDDIQGSLQFD
jgi:topoisomerase-4 subunit A